MRMRVFLFAASNVDVLKLAILHERCDLMGGDIEVRRRLIERQKLGSRFDLLDLLDRLRILAAVVNGNISPPPIRAHSLWAESGSPTRAKDTLPEFHRL